MGNDVRTFKKPAAMSNSVEQQAFISGIAEAMGKVPGASPRAFFLLEFVRESRDKKI